MKTYHFVYRTTHIPTGRYYTGVHSTKNLDDGYIGSGTKLRHMLNKHPLSDFKFEVVYQCGSREEAFDVEAMIIQPFLLDKKLYPQVLNIKSGGYGAITLSTEALNNMKAACNTPASKAKRSAAAKARWADPEQAEILRDKIVALNKDPELKAKRRESFIATLALPERRTAFAKAVSKGHQSAEARANHSRANAEQANKPERKAKASENAKKRWSDPVWRAETIERMKGARERKKQLLSSLSAPAQ